MARLLALVLLALLPLASHANELDDLFSQLQVESDVKNAGRISAKIWQQWQSPPDPTTDLMAGWARTAMEKQNYSAALDILDQLIIYAPDFAEGWNQRATVHFLQENYGRSIADIERTLLLEPRHFGALAGLATIQEILEQPRRALQTWYKVLEIYPAMRDAQDSVLKLEEELAAEENSL